MLLNYEVFIVHKTALNCQVPLSAEKFSNFILFFSVGPDDISLY